MKNFAIKNPTRNTLLLVFFSSTFLMNCSHFRSKSDPEVVPSSCQVTQNSGSASGHASDADVKNGKKDQVMVSIFEENVSKLRELIASGENIHAKDALGYSYLHLAAGVGNPEVIETLVSAGIPVNIRLGKKHSTPAHSAAKWGKLSSLRSLAKSGADFNLKDADGKTPAQIAAENDQKAILEYLKLLGKNEG